MIMVIKLDKKVNGQNGNGKERRLWLEEDYAFTLQYIVWVLIQFTALRR